jgi:two-component system, NarL family, response regulator LiaR
MNEPPIRVVLADDHAIVREGTAELLERAGLHVVGQAANGEDAVRLVEELHPDVLVIDLVMPGVDGLEAIRRVRRLVPTPAVLALTAHEDDPYVLAALEAGVNGYLTKAARGRKVVDAVRTVAGGGSVFAPSVASRVLRRAVGHDGGPLEERLTDRERAVLAAAARGLGNKQIAAELAISPRTVQTHLTHVFGKLGVSSRTEAVLRALKEGWVSVS